MRTTSLAIVLTAVLSGARPAYASAIVFTDRDAFLAATEADQELTITAFEGGGISHVIYGDMLPVSMDILEVRYLAEACGFPSSLLGCSSLPQRNLNPFPLNIEVPSDIVVGAFTSPITAVGYDLVGDFKLFGQPVHATDPFFVGFLFDEPTTHLPLPELATFIVQPPEFNQPAQLALPYVAEHITVRSAPEPATWLLLS